MKQKGFTNFSPPPLEVKVKFRIKPEFFPLAFFINYYYSNSDTEKNLKIEYLGSLNNIPSEISSGAFSFQVIDDCFSLTKKIEQALAKTLGHLCFSDGFYNLNAQFDALSELRRSEQHLTCLEFSSVRSICHLDVFFEDLSLAL